MTPPFINNRRRYPWAPAPTTARTPPFLNPGSTVQEDEELASATGQPVENTDTQAAPDPAPWRGRVMEEWSRPREQVGLGRKIAGTVAGLFLGPEVGENIKRPGELDRRRNLLFLAQQEEEGEKAQLARDEAARRGAALEEETRSNRMRESYNRDYLGLQRDQLDQNRLDREENRNTTRSSRLLQMGAVLQTKPMEQYPPGSISMTDPLTNDPLIIIPEDQRDLQPVPAELRRKYPDLPAQLPRPMVQNLWSQLITGDRQMAHDERMASRAEASAARADARAATREDTGFARQSAAQLQQLRTLEQQEANRIEAEKSNDIDRLGAEAQRNFDTLYNPDGSIKQEWLPRYKAILDEYDRKRQMMYSGSRSRMRALKPDVQDVIIEPSYRREGAAQPTPAAQPQAAPAPAAPGQSLDAPPASALKEGINTTFGNGQTWTLRNGQPTRVK